MMTHRKRDPFLNVVFIAIAFFVAFLVTEVARADPLIELGVQQSMYTDGPSNEWSFKANVGWEGFPVYGWGAYEPEVGVKLRGQPLADVDTLSFGIGARKSWDNFFVALETGYSLVDTSVNAEIQQEVVYTHLVARHNVYQRPVPVTVDGPYDTKGYTSSWEADDGPMARLVIGYQLSDHVALTGAYKWLYVDQEMYIRDINWQPGRGYWREDNQIDLSSVEVGVWFVW